MVEGTEGEDYVIAPHAIADSDLQRNVYGAGDRVPIDDAVKYGLVKKTAKTTKRAKKAAEDRAKKPSENRGLSSETAGVLKKR